MSTLGRRIAAARIEASLTTEQLGAACGDVSGAAVYKWETDKARPRVDKLPLIARATGKPISYFMPDDEDATSGRDGFVPPEFEAIAATLERTATSLRRSSSGSASETSGHMTDAVPHHPGIEALLGDPHLVATWQITEQEAASLRAANLGFSHRVDEVDDAVDLLRIMRRTKIAHQDRK